MNRLGFKLLLRLLIVLISATFLFSFVFLIVMACGQFEGQEFSPDTVSRRDFSFVKLPLVGTQVFGEENDSSGKLEKYLVDNNYVIPINVDDPRWHLIHDSWTNPNSEDLDARYLTEFFDEYDEDGGLFWLDWTDKNQELAKVLWPVVFESARRYQYLPIPDMMEAARTSVDANQIKQTLDEIVCDYRIDVARAFAEDGEFELAEKELDDAANSGLDSEKINKAKSEISSLSVSSNSSE